MKLRVAQHTKDLNSIKWFYTEILDLKVLGSFQDHEGYDGIFLGLKGNDWHLEFTSSSDDPEHQSDDDDLLVFYIESQDQFDRILDKVALNDISMLKAKNPYWNKYGITIQDPDGFRIVVVKPNE